MTEIEFLDKVVNNCPCGNKVRPTIEYSQDHSATIDHPTIACGYCKTHSGLFWPEQYQECLEAWEKVTNASR